MEEIDIAELLKRVKEGNAPKEIMINGDKYDYFKDWMTLDETYFTKAHGCEENICYWEMDFMTKIKILDKPIIEELNPRECYFKDGTELVHKKMYDKINEIVRRINKGE